MKDTILITGGSGNLGKEILLFFDQKEYQVIAPVRNIEKANLHQSGNIKYVQLNVSHKDEIKAAFNAKSEDFTNILAGVFLTGGFRMDSLENASIDSLNSMLETNFYPVFTMANALFKLFKDRGNGGCLIAIGAKPAIYSDMATEMISYALSKSLLVKFLEIINTAGRAHGIYAHCIVPGTIDTPVNREAMPKADYTKWVAPIKIAELIYKLIKNPHLSKNYIWELG